MITEYVVILVDGDDQVMAVRCPDEAAANEVGGAAVLSDGGVSAYLLPPTTGYVDYSHELSVALVEGMDLTQIRDEVL